MKKIQLPIFGILMILILCRPILTWAQESNEAPRFEINGEPVSLDKLPLIHVEGDVQISGVIARVKMTQVYENKGDSAINATYVFPASSRSAVYDMHMTIGERFIRAEIKEKKAAQKVFNEAKKAGKSASLLQQHRPNVFQMDVANIKAGETVKVELFYTELLVPENGEYTLFYPTVVGPRYDTKNTAWVNNPSTHQKTYKQAAQTHTFDLQVALEGGMPIKSVESTSHSVVISFDGENRATIQLNKNKRHEGNRDFILKYRLSGDQIETGLLLFEGEKENFFLMMAQPPARVPLDKIPPREYIFVMDISGSMDGFPIETSKALLKDLVGSLRVQDRFNLILFAGSDYLLSETSLEGSPDNIKQAIQIIENQQAVGGTEILPALERALQLPTPENFSRTIIVATDGLVTVEKEALDLIRNNLNKANLFAFGIGSSMNQYIIEAMAHAGQGEPFIINNPDVAQKSAARFRDYISKPVMTNISFSALGFETYDVEPLTIPDIFAERPVLVYGKWKGALSGVLKLNGLAGAANNSYSINVQDFKPSANNDALPYLWARYKIMQLQDYQRTTGISDSTMIFHITQLGLDYNLLTDYTSFVAVDNNPPAEAQQENKIIAMANNSGSTPEPHEWALIALLVLFVTFLIRYVKF